MATEPLRRENEDLVEVFSTREESEAQVVRGLLESNEIEAIVLPLEAPQDVLPGVGPIVVRVPASQAEDARQLIAASREPYSESDTDANEPPPAA